MPNKSHPRFLLVNPWIHDFAAFNLWMRPLGFLQLYSYLRNTGYEVDFLDALDVSKADAEKYNLNLPTECLDGRGKIYSERLAKPKPYRDIPRYYRRFGMPPAVFREKLRRLPRPDYVFVTSAMTYWYPGVQETIDAIKEVYPNTPVILGGNYATLCDRHASENSGADWVIGGRWEESLVPFLSSELKLEFKGGKIPFPEMPSPANDLYPDSRFAVIRLSRGCPFQCKYCASNILCGDYACREATDVLREITWNVDQGRENIAFYDDALLIGWKNRLRPLLASVIERDIKCKFHTPNGLHTRYVNREVAEMFYASGFQTVRLSFEATRGVAREMSDGKAEPNDLEKALSALFDAGYKEGDIEVYMLLGLRNQSDEEIFETANFITSVGGKVRTAQYSPVPGTKLFEAEVQHIPELKREPLLQNSTIAPAWDFDVKRYDRIKGYIRELRETPG
jgi:radical SAM superfamily enzyme YgiQ (UPF0313 family)